MKDEFFCLTRSSQSQLDINSNFTPKVVGNQVDINPLFSIIAIIFFGTFWGVGGVILALPLVSIVRIILDQMDSTKALATLMSTDISDAGDPFAD